MHHLSSYWVGFYLIHYFLFHFDDLAYLTAQGYEKVNLQLRRGILLEVDSNRVSTSLKERVVPKFSSLTNNFKYKIY